MTAADRFLATCPVVLAFGGHPKRAGSHGLALLDSVP